MDLRCIMVIEQKNSDPSSLFGGRPGEPTWFQMRGGCAVWVLVSEGRDS